MKRSDVYRIAAVLALFAVMSPLCGCAGSDSSDQSSAAASQAENNTHSKTDSSTEGSTDSKTESTDESSEVSSPRSVFVGKWASEDYNGSFIYTFNEDGTGNYDMMGSELDFKYSVDSDKIMTITFTAEGYTPMNVAYTIEGDKLTISDTLGTKNVFIKQ